MKYKQHDKIAFPPNNKYDFPRIVTILGVDKTGSAPAEYLTSCWKDDEQVGLWWSEKTLDSLNVELLDESNTIILQEDEME